MNTTITNVLTVLNTGSYLTDPYNGTRVGSFAFGPDYEMTFGKYMPKIHVTDGDYSTDRYTFGKSRRLKQPTINIYFYTKDGDKDFNTNYKNRQLVYDYLDKIEDAISNNMTLIPNVKSPQFGNVGRVIYVQEQKIYWGVKPVTFTFIKEPTS